VKASEYIPDGEDVLHTLDAEYDDSRGSDGELALTARRLVYVDDTKVVDLNPARVDAVRFEAGGGDALPAAAPFGLVLLQNNPAGILALVVAVAVLVVGLLVWLLASTPEHTLHVDTPSGTHTFTSRDDSLAEVASAVRAV